MTITLRTQSQTGTTTKGSTLTHAELDNNFIDLLTNKIKPIDVRGDTGTQLVGQTLTNEILQVVGGVGISTAVTSDSAGQAKIIITASATGDVAGPASSTDNAITRFDATTGKLLQNSQVTVADDGAITAPSVGSVIPFYFANQAAFPSAATYHGAIAHSHSDGKMYFAHGSVWNALANASDAFGGTLNDLTDVTISAPSNGQVLKYNSATSQFVNGTGGIDGLYADPNPSLGGNLTVMGFSIVSVSNGNIELAPNGTGDVYLTADTVRVGDNNANATITTNGTGDLTLDTNSGSNSGRITIEDGSNGDITLAPNGTGRVEILGTANQQASIRLFEELSSAGNNQSTLLQASKFISADITLTLPNTTSTLGYQNLPAVGTKTGSYTLALADIGKYVQVGSGGSITIPNSTFAEGDVIVIANNHTAAITITCTITDAYIGGTDTDKATVSLATRGVCNILFLSATRCIITGNVS